MIHNYITSQFYTIILLILVSCESQNEKLFTLLHSEFTHIDFENTIHESAEFNILTNEYIFNGGGIAVADFNNDGLPDLFFTGNMVSNRLYLNQGEMRFKDITSTSNLTTENYWSTGVAIADVNADGLMDIYVCGAMLENSRANKLYVHQGLNANGIPTFKEQAFAYGVDDQSNSMAATFLDYDNDGDLDLYVLNNEQNESIPTNYRKKITDGTAKNNDKLYRNNGNGSFTDITIEAGITIEGFGLSVTPLDVNKDNWVDLFITNDYLTNDLLYVNQKNGTFKNEIDTYLLHQSKFSMGSDASDFNNDGQVDLVTLDMLGESHERKKTTIAKSSFFQNVLNKKWGYQDQHMRNMLFKNNGTQLPFSEIGQYSGIYQTDWSWSPLFYDMDYDGNRDLLITNGFPRDITDMDFANYRLTAGPYTPKETLLDSIPVVKIPNYAFENQGDLKFNDVSAHWGLNIPSFSNGAIVSDLDLDGDLDYVVNNINESVFVFENNLFQKKQKPNFIQISLQGQPQNSNALGAKVVLRIKGNKILYQEQQISRGYMSSVDPILYFGLGDYSNVESIEVLWPSGKYSLLKSPSVNQRITLNEEEAKETDTLEFPLTERKQETQFNEVGASYGIDYLHQEKNVQDFFTQRLLPHKLSQNGPCIVVGDINGDSLEDFIIGSASGFSPVIFLQSEKNTFQKKELFTTEEEKAPEVEGMSLLDSDGDGDLDLFLVSGGNQFERGSDKYLDRLLINDGKGNFRLDAHRIPQKRSNSSMVRAADFDLDGDQDLFVGGSNLPNAYPLADESYILENVDGTFIDQTQSLFSIAPNFGLVADAKWADINNDGRPDLLVVGEYSEIQLFINTKKGFERSSDKELKQAKGLWRSIETLDFDNDGDIDMLLGNLGKNHMFSISPQTPLYINTSDIDKNGSIDPIMFCIQKNSEGESKFYPTQFWDNLTQQSPLFRQEFNSYSAFSKASMDYYKTTNFIKDSSLLYATLDSSVWVENLGKKGFKIHPLPDALQLGPVNSFLVFEEEEEAYSILYAGNDFGGPPFEGNFDGLLGGNLKIEKKVPFISSAEESGFYVYGDVKDLKTITLQNGKKVILVAQNGANLKVFEKTN